MNDSPTFEFLWDDVSLMANELLNDWVEAGSYPQNHCYDLMRKLGACFIPRPKELEETT